MSRTRKHPKRRQPFNPVKTFFKVMLSIVMVFVVLAGGACFAYHKVTGEWPFGGDTIAKDADETSMLDALLGRNMKLNVAVFGVDADGTRTDVAFVVHYDSSQESLSLLSIPRDTRVDVCTDVARYMTWDMSDTGDIKIDLKKGLQTLDGNKALQLVRFRKGYANGDVGRIQVQQMFLKALATKVLSTESIVKNLGDYIKVMYKYVDTDVSLSDALKYANYITKIDMSKMTMETLPGVGQYISGVSYFIHDPAETTEVVDRLFYNVAPAGNTDSDSSNSKDLTIEVSNGGTVAGLAARFTELLKNEGYTLTEPTNYTGE